MLGTFLSFPPPPLSPLSMSSSTPPSPPLTPPHTHIHTHGSVCAAGETRLSVLRTRRRRGQTRAEVADELSPLPPLLSTSIFPPLLLIPPPGGTGQVVEGEGFAFTSLAEKGTADVGCWMLERLFLAQQLHGAVSRPARPRCNVHVQHLRHECCRNGRVMPSDSAVKPLLSPPEQREWSFLGAFCGFIVMALCWRTEPV